jgi:hypothetical protein
MTVDQAIRVVQLSYPQVDLACHTRHQRKRSTEHHLSARDLRAIVVGMERLASACRRIGEPARFREAT